ncbi:putative serpin E3 [Dissostichus eleginoides]|uniref:Serpin E3 n=1 Tax=Dissostichus eleginoides TaxID=100907 RepID=A0AAD9FER9_DISEL|nr:putative serpin E3 [Dissostichus eleginoides]
MCRPLLASLVICFWLVERSRCSSSLQDGMGELHNRFSVSLYQTLTETENISNLIVSPVSVSLSLGLLQLGARGNTLAQLEGALGYSVKDEGGVSGSNEVVSGPQCCWYQEVWSGAAAAASEHSGVWSHNTCLHTNSNLIKLLLQLGRGSRDATVQNFLLHSHSDMRNNSQGIWLQQTCTLFVQSGVQLLSEFTKHAAVWANTSVVRANFSQPNPRQQERAGNNQDEPLQSGSSSGELSGSGEAQAEALWWGHRLQMALVNTVAFRGVWQKQFLFTNTQNLPFTLPDGSAIKVPMMYQATEVSFGQFRTASDHRYTVLELPYLGRSLSLQVALPSERKTPLSCIESQLTARQLASWETGLRRTKMDVFLPRFRMQNKFNLRSVLPAMGISDAFNPTAADFSEISAEESLYVSDAFHEVRIEVTEDGTKAAAATAMVLLKRSRAPVFKADRPFLFLIRQVNTGSILFMGRVMNPADQTP